MKKIWFIYLLSYIRRSGSGVIYQPNLFYLFLGIGSYLYIIIQYYIKLSFCSYGATLYLLGSCKCFNFICCNVYEPLILSERFSFESLDYWQWSYFLVLYNFFFFWVNHYYSKYIVVCDYLECTSQPDY